MHIRNLKKVFFCSSKRRRTRSVLGTGVQTFALPFFGNTAFKDLSDCKSVDNWLSKISAPVVNRSMGQSGVSSPRLTTTDRHGCIKLIQSAVGLSVGRRAEDQKALDGLEILRTGVTVVNVPKNLESIRQILALEFPWVEDVTKDRKSTRLNSS